MRFFRYLIILLAAAAFAAPATANAAPGAFTVLDGGDFGQGFFDSANPGQPDHDVSIFTGETVSFNYPVGLGTHNVAFIPTGPQPSSCAQTAGPVLGAIPPLPTYTIPAPWAGNCTFNNPGTYTFVCQAHGDMVGTITVTTKVNAPPTVTAGRTPSGDTTTGTAIAFTATGSDADGDTLSYSWDFGDGETSTSQNPTHTYATPGTKTAKVTVSDGKGGTGEATLSIVVTQANRNPLVTAARTPAGVLAVGQSAAFTATGSDADGDTVTYSWDFGDGSPASTEQNPSHAYTAVGDYTAKVTVSDGRGGTGSANVGVTVTQTGNAAPTVTSSRTPTGNTRVGVPITFSAVGTDADGDTLSYSWNFGDGTPASTEQNPVHAFLTAATFNVVVTVNDGRGGTASAAPLQVVVQANRAPTISAASASPAEGMAPLNVTFAATATDADGHALTYEWDLDGDGTFETTGQNPSRTYTASASPVLRVSDGFGGVATRTLASAPNGGGVNVFAETLDPNARYNVLVFSRTAAFRHSAIDEAYNAIKLMGSQQNFTVDWTEDPTRFNDAFLSRYDLVVFNSTTGDVLNDTQQGAFERFIKAGGGYTGIHSATDTEYGWAWYGQLTGAYFRNHPNGTPTATVVVEDTESPATVGLPARWTRVDEWYNFQKITDPVVNGGGDRVSPRTQTPIHVLLTMDESSYVEDDGNTINEDHPIAWCKRYDGGRMFYTALGHTEATYTDANFLRHLRGGMEVAAGVLADDDCGLRAPAVNATRVPAGSVETGEPVAFTSGASDGDGDTLTYAWDFGDGGTSTEANPTHTFAAVGDYGVKLIVTDGRFTTEQTMPVTVHADSTDTAGDISADVPLVLALDIAGPATFDTFTPGVSRDYTTTATAQVTSTAGSADLTVIDPSTTNTGKLVNGTYVLEQPLQVKATDTANPNTVFGAVKGEDSPLALLSYPRAISADAVTIGFQQSVGAAETLRAGAYTKTLRFTLSTTTP
jgi:PKD repeat protein/type 1 glutamine amidotransferase